MNRCLMYLCTLTATCGWAPAAEPATEPAAWRPNILLVLADDVGREVLGCYGGTSYQTPRLDELARGGIQFHHAYAMPVCHPTRVCLLTGQYPFRLGHPEWGSFPKAVESRTVAQVLKGAGYRTAVAGKWQLAMLKDDLDQPHRMGFEDYCLFGWHEGPRYYQPHIWQNGALRQDVAARYGPDVYCDFLIEFMTRKQDQPFFAFYSMALCHDVTDDLDHPVPLGPQGRYDTYAEMVESMDEHVGRIVDALDQYGLRESTVVLFIADNGTPQETIETAIGDTYVRRPVISEMGDAEIPGGKTELTDWGTRVPMIANWPGHIAPEQQKDDLIDLSDFLPTIAQLANVELPPEWQPDGQSFAGLLRGETGNERTWVFAEHKGHWFVKNRRWKLYDDGRFFDMHNDPNEQQPLSPAARSADAEAAYLQLQHTTETLFLPK